MSVKPGKGVLCNSRTQEAEAERSRVQGYPHLQSQKRASLVFVYLSRKERRNKQPLSERKRRRKRRRRRNA